MALEWNLQGRRSRKICIVLLFYMNLLKSSDENKKYPISDDSDP